MREACERCGKALNAHATIKATPDGTVYVCPSSPRVARSPEDLKAGQWVAWCEPGTNEWGCAEYDPDMWDWTGTEIILQEAPVDPVEEAKERLREELDRKENCLGYKGDMHDERVADAARALLEVLDA